MGRVVVCLLLIVFAGASVASARVVKQGTNGPDRLVGTAAADRLVGKGGRDKLYGRGGTTR